MVPNPVKMLNISVKDSLSIRYLVNAKRVALRRGVWFKALSRVERGIVDLVAKYVDTIKSMKLANVLMVILNKLKQATESMVDRLVRTTGVPLAKKVSSMVVSWGNHMASKWAEDADFARYIAFNLAKT